MRPAVSFSSDVRADGGRRIHTRLSGWRHTPPGGVLGDVGIVVTWPAGQA
jgi:hypothetical protein